MVHRFWRSETAIIWAQYLAAGLSVVPIGILYLVLMGQFGEKRAFYFCFVASVVIGLIVWAGVGYGLRRHFAVLHAIPNQQISNELSQIIYTDQVWLAPKLSIKAEATRVGSQSDSMYAAHHC
jgi:hypothetical protein